MALLIKIYQNDVPYFKHIFLLWRIIPVGNYIILPGCDDGNRGDQALVWETKKVAQEAGYYGQFHMLCSCTDALQSKRVGINPILPILRHPGRKFKNKNNSHYGISLLVRWGTVAVGDFILSKIVYWRFTRKIFAPLFNSKTKKTLAVFESCDACFVKGGGFIHSYGKPTDIYTIYYFLYHIRLAQHMNKKVYFLPNSFGPFVAKGVKRQIRKVLLGCEMVFTRESVSQNALSELGISSELYPDLAFGLRKSEEVPKIVNEIRLASCGKPMIAITARPYRFGESSTTGGYSEYVEALVGFCKYLSKNGYYPVLVEHTLAENTNESDLKCLNKIAARLEHGSYYLFEDKLFDCRMLKSLYSQMHAVVGTCFHSVIFALSEHIPCIAITYGGNKGKGIMHDIGLEQYSIAIDNVTVKKICDAFFMIEKNRGTYLITLNDYLLHASLNRIDMILKIANGKI